MMIKSEYEARQVYDEMLNEVSDLVRINGLPYEPATVLKQIDPIAYRVGFNDWLDCLIRNGEVPEEAEEWTSGY